MKAPKKFALALLLAVATLVAILIIAIFSSRFIF